jgi:hypothetical protein
MPRIPIIDPSSVGFSGFTRRRIDRFSYYLRRPLAALSILLPERFDAWLLLGIFAVQFLYPQTFVRLTAAFVLFVYAIDLFVAHRRAVPPVLRTAFGKPGGGA